jgi:hypothetical protein
VHNFINLVFGCLLWSVKEQNEKTISELKQEWGRDYDNRMEDARSAFKDMGLEEDVAEEVGKLIGVGNTVKLFDALMCRFSEGFI